MLVTALAEEVKRRTTMACMMMKRPTEATTLAKTGALRSGRKISRWKSRPRMARTPAEIRRASHTGMAGWRMMVPKELDPAPGWARVMNTGMLGRLKDLFPARWTMPSIGASGLGSGGRKSCPLTLRP